jgi:hypothetical protein
MHPSMFEFNMGMNQGFHLSCENPQIMIGLTSLFGHKNPTKPFDSKMFVHVHPLELKNTFLVTHENHS